MQSQGGAEIDWKKVAWLAGFIALGVILWDNPVLWPLKVLVVMMHESGHAIATWIAGGSVTEIRIAANESGQCLSMMPPSFFGRVLLSSGGYVGSAVAGAVLLIATFRFGARRLVLGAACVWLVVFGLLLSGDWFTRLFCLGSAAVMFACAKWLPTKGVELLNLLLASFTGLYAVFDLRSDLWNSAVRGQTDAAILASHTFIPAIVWAFLWSVASIAILFFAARWSLRKSIAIGKAPASPGFKGASSL